MNTDRTSGIVSSINTAYPYHKYGVLLLGLTVSVFYLLMSGSSYYFLEGASAGDILLARALGQGEGFREIWRLGQPASTVRPPGPAFMFAALFKIFPEDLLALTLANNLFGPLGFAGSTLLLRRRLGLLSAAVISFAAFTIPFCIQVSLHLYSGALFTATLFFSMIVFERASDQGFAGRGTLIAFGLLAGTAFMARSIGIVLPGAALLSLALTPGVPARRKVEGAVLIGVFSALIIGGWTLRNYLVAGSQDQPYFSKVLAGEPIASTYWMAEDHGIPLIPKPRSLTSRLFFQRLRDNTNYYISDSAIFFVPALNLAPRPLPNALSALFLLLSVAGLAAASIARRGAPEFCALLMLALIWVWPFPDSRFFLPIMPILIWGGAYAVMIGFRRLIRGPARRNAGWSLLARAMAVSLTVIVMLANLAENIATVRGRFQAPLFKIERGPRFIMAATRPAAAQSLILLDQLRSLAAQDDIIMFHSLAACGIVSERTCAAPPMARPEKFMQYLDDNQIAYVVMDSEQGQWGASFFSFHYMLPTIIQFPDRFQEIASSSFPEQGHSPARSATYLVVRKE